MSKSKHYVVSIRKQKMQFHFQLRVNYIPREFRMSYGLKCQEITVKYPRAIALSTLYISNFIWLPQCSVCWVVRRTAVFSNVWNAVWSLMRRSSRPLGKWKLTLLGCSGAGKKRTRSSGALCQRMLNFNRHLFLFLLVNVGQSYASDAYDNPCRIPTMW